MSPTRQMKILTLSNYFPEHVGGIEFVAYNLVKHWRKHHQVRWIASDVKMRPHLYEPDDVHIHTSNFTEEHLGFPYPIPLGNSLFQIFNQVRWSDVVQIHDCLYSANVIAFWASRLYKKPLLITQHAALADFPVPYKRALQWLAYKTLGRMILENAEQVVFISSRVKSWFENWTRIKHQALFIPNGVDHNVFYPLTPEERELRRAQLGYTADQIVLLFVGRFAENKGIQYVHAIAQSRSNYHWLMLGHGAINPHEWGLPNIRVIPPQSQAELQRYYSAADLFILPSVGEGFPLSVQEALSCGLPVAVSQETANFLSDSPLLKLDITSLPDMLQLLDDLFSDRKRISSLRTESKEYAQRWDWEKVAESYETLFNKIIGLHTTPDNEA